jgi:hypothetical protein
MQKRAPEPEPEPVDPFVADERYATYIKMKKMLPDGPVRQKMMNDGVLTGPEIDGFFDGVYVAPTGGVVPKMIAPPPSAGGRPPPPPPGGKGGAPPPPTPASPSAGRLAGLQTVKLNQAASRPRPPSAAVKNAPGMLSLLANAMNNNRVLFNGNSDDENESDGGFSDDDFDDADI